MIDSGTGFSVGGLESALLDVSRACARPDSEDFIVDGLTYCGRCGTRKQTFVEVQGKRLKVNCICACENDAHIREQARAADMRKRQMADAARARAFGTKAPRRTFADDDGLQPSAMAVVRRYADEFDAAMASGVGLLLTGRPRQGKTFAAECVANELLRRGRTVVKESASLLADKAQRKGFDREGWIEPIRECDLLILDDLGAERATSFGKSVVFSAIDARVSARKPMIVTTNLSLADMRAAQVLDDQRCFMRVIESCVVVEFADVRSVATNSGCKDFEKKYLQS